MTDATLIVTAFPPETVIINESSSETVIVTVSLDGVPVSNSALVATNPLPETVVATVGLPNTIGLTVYRHDTVAHIDDLVDVAITAPIAGQVIKRNATNTGWVNEPDAVGAGFIGTVSYVSDHPGTLTRGMAVCLINGVLRRATSAAGFSKCIGLVFEDVILQGTFGRVQTDGNAVATALMWNDATGMTGGLAQGQIYFLSATGAITPFPPTVSGSYLAPIGIALDNTTMRIELNPTIIL